MIKLHFLNELYYVEAETVLQIERWLIKKNYIKDLQKQGLYFQGLLANKDGDMNDLLKYKEQCPKEVWALIFDLNEEEENITPPNTAGQECSNSKISVQNQAQEFKSVKERNCNTCERVTAGGGEKIQTFRRLQAKLILKSVS